MEQNEDIFEKCKEVFKKPELAEEIIFDFNLHGDTIREKSQKLYEVTDNADFIYGGVETLSFYRIDKDFIENINRKRDFKFKDISELSDFIGTFKNSRLYSYVLAPVGKLIFIKNEKYYILKFINFSE